jgi:hypothetical protein
MRNEEFEMRNNKKEQRGRFFLTRLIALCSLLFVVACENPFDPPKTKKPAAMVATGMGYFSLALDEPGAARTIMPEIGQSDFAAYTLEFFAEGTGGGDIITDPDVTEDRTNENLSESVLLNAGTWDLQVTAYMDAEKTEPAAKGELKGIVIDAGATTVESIILEPITDGTGTFSWNISYPSNIIYATMTITRMPLTSATAVAARTITFTNDPSSQTGSVELDSGYYRIVFKLHNDEGLKTERWETLHIYQNMESASTSGFTDIQFNQQDIDIEDFGQVMPIIFNVANTAEWDEAVSAITNGGNNRNYIINVIDDFSVMSSYYTFGNVSDITVSLRGVGRTLTLYDNGNMLLIGSNQNIILRDVTLRGHDQNNNSLVYVSGGTFTMNGGKISGNTASSDNGGGGGVYVFGGTFTMNSGEISGNSASYGGGGGVHVNAGGTFTMNGGKISGNTAYQGGGVIVVSGTFTMNGGEVSGNTADRGGGVDVYSSGTFLIVTGIIYGSGEEESIRNTATNGAALYIDYGTVQYGTVDGTTWNSNGSLDTTNNTIRVLNGDLITTFDSVIADGSSLQPTTALTLTFNQAIPGLSADDITLSGVSGVQKGTLSGDGPVYTLPISGFSSGGTLNVSVAKLGYTISDSQKIVTIYIPSVTFDNVTADGSSSQPTTQLTLTFDQEIIGLSADDITLNGVSGVEKGILSGDGPVYTLPISGFSSGGTLEVSVAKSGYNISDSQKTVTIYVVSVTLNSVIADGSSSQPTTQLTLTFNQAIPGLSADDITLSGVSGIEKGFLSGSGPVYTLPISGFGSSGILYVSVAKSGYAISDSQETVTVYVVSVTLNSVTANGSPSQTSTQLTLTFDQVIPGLSADDITLSGAPDVQKWTLSGSGPVYTLSINANSGGTLYVSVTKSGYSISYSQMTATIYSVLSGTVSITGIAQTGQTLTANTDSLGGSGTISYQWMRDEITNIGTDSDTYVVQFDDEESTITVTVTRSGNSGSVTSSAIAIPIGGTEANPYRLTQNVWMDGNIPAYPGERWYSFEAAAGTAYRVWWNDSGDGDGTKTLNTQVTAYDSNRNQLFSEYSGWDTPRSTPIISGSTIYLKVTPWNSANTGTFAIAYTASTGMRPGIPNTPLTVNTWANGVISTSGREVWYSFTNVTGTSYRVWWNDSSDGDGTKTLNTRVTAYDSNWNQLFSEYSGWDTPRTIPVTSGSTIYLRVTPWNSGNTGTFAIAYTTSTGIRPGIPNTSLTVNTWANGVISTSDREVWYSFSASTGTNYRVWWNSGPHGDGTKTLDVWVTAYDSNWNQLFYEYSGWDTPRTLTPSLSGTIYLKVTPYNSGSTGTFAIAYSSNTGARPGLVTTSLTANAWANDFITTSDREAWYSFTATAGTSYRVWWNSDPHGDGTKTLDVWVTAYDSNWNQLFYEYSGWDTPKTLTPSLSGTIYLRVAPYHTGGNGTFGIVYGTGSTRP